MTLTLPVLSGSGLTADRLPGLAFTILFVKILQELCRLFGTHLAHRHGLLLGLLATIVGGIALTIAGVFLRLFRLLFGLFAGTAFAVGTFTVLAAAGLTILTILLILILVLILIVAILILVLILILILILVLILVLVIILIPVVLLILVLLLVLGFVDTVQEHL